MKKNLLITGGCGYIGSWFLKNYSNLYNIKVIDTMFFNEINHKFDKIKYLQKDIRQIEASDLNGIDYVVHMAELSNDPLGELNPKLTQEINIQGTKKLLEVCRKSSIKKFVYMSSCSVYGDSGDLHVSEKSPTNPLTEYAKAKIENEKFLLNNFFNFQIKILRNATAFGFSPNTRTDLVINDLTVGALENNQIIVMSDGSPKRPFVHIGDISRFIHFLIENDETEKLLVNVGSENLNYTVKEIANIVSEVSKINSISFGEKNGDARSYFVDFSYLKSKFPKFEFHYDVTLGVNELINNFYTVSENKLNNKRIKKINYLLQNRKIDNNLYWISDI